MISRGMFAVFSPCAVLGFLAMSGCGPLLGLDEYTKNDGGMGGTAGMGNGGEGGLAGQGGGGQGGAGECMPNETASCYDGAMGTEGKGVCKAGQKTCGADNKYGPCVGQVVPQLENCAIPTDEDCNGTTADCTGIATWSVAYGSAANQQIGFAATGMSDGAVVVIGEYTDTVAFGACGNVSTSITNPNIFLAKLNSDGTCNFVKEFGDMMGYDYGYDVALAKNDDIVITGGFTSAGINFGGDVLAAQGSNDVYLAKFDKTGQHLWSKRYGDAKDQLSYAVGLDANDDIFIAGDFGGALDFGDGIGVSVPAFDTTAGFVAKLDPDGKAIYSHSFDVGSSVGSFVQGTRLAVDPQGYATVIGRFKGSLSVGSNTVTSTGSYADIFVLRYAPDGTLVYAKKFGALEEEFNPDAATAPDGSVYISGKTLGTSLNLGDFVMNKTVTGAGGGDVFLIKLNPDGSFADAKVFGNNGDQGARSVVVDPLGHVILAGAYAGQIDFGKGPLNATPSTLFVAKFDSSLKALWSKGFFSNQDESGINVGVDATANILLTGGFMGALQIEAGKALTQQGGGDIYVAKLAP